MESSEVQPLPTSRRDDKPYGPIKSAANSKKAQAETELSNARKTVRDLAMKIEESNSRAKSMQEKRQKTVKPQGKQEHEVSVKNKEDYQYAQVVKEIERVKHELSELKLDMKRVLKGKKQAENASKVSSSKQSTLTSAIERIKKEIEEIDEEHVLVELARIEAVKEREAIEAQSKEESNRYQTQLKEVKNQVKEVDQHSELTQELQLTVYNVHLLEKELSQAKEPKMTSTSLHTITEEIETAKTQLANIKREGYNFMTSIDVIRNELKHVQEETTRLEKEEENRDLMIQTLNSDIIKGKARLESVTATAEKANSISSNLSLMVEQLRAETETAKKERELISRDIEKVKLEIPKTEADIELSEKRLAAVMEELTAAKSSEHTALENLKDLVDSTVRSRELTSMSKSTIKITTFEYKYLTGKAGGAEEIADKKVAAAQAWVEALKANEKEILMKIKTAKREVIEFHVEVGDGDGDASGTGSGTRRMTVDGALNRLGQNGVKVLASPRRSMYKIGNMTPGKRRSQKFPSPAARHSNKSASFTRRREKVPQSLGKLLTENGEMGE